VSPVILLGLVVMWAVVLIPMWLKRHDEVEETRSVDRFTNAMHTLSRREAPADKRRYIVMPHRSSSHEVHVSGASAAGGGRKPARRPAARPPVTAATRRQRTLIGLLLVAVVTLVAAVVIGGLALWALQAVVDLALVAFVMHLRNRAQRAALVQRARRRSAAPVRATPRYEPVYDDRAAASTSYDEEFDDESYERFEPVAVGRAAAGGAIFDQTAAQDRRVEFDDVAVGESGVRYRFDDTSEEPAAAEAAFDQSAAAEAAAGRDVDIDNSLSDPADQPEVDATGHIGARPWEPVPVPKPTYQSKPAAPRRTKPLPEFEPLLPPVETAAELDPVDDLEEILDRRWAVND
jgi:hypothetical protein